MKSKVYNEISRYFKDKNGSITIIGRSGVGKTALAIDLLNELVTKKDKVYYMTPDNEMDVLKRIPEKEKLMALNNMRVTSIRSNGVFAAVIDEAIKFKYSKVVIDAVILTSNTNMAASKIIADALRKLKSHRIDVIIVTNVLNGLNTSPEDMLNVKPSELIFCSDFVIAVNKTEAPSKLKKVLRSIMFWKKVPNCRIDLLKNRNSGKNISEDIYVPTN